MIIWMMALSAAKRRQRLQKINKEGRDAFFDGKSKDNVPYQQGEQEYNNWIAGFDQAQEDLENNKKTFVDWLKNPNDRIKKNETNT